MAALTIGDGVFTMSQIRWECAHGVPGRVDPRGAAVIHDIVQTMIEIYRERGPMHRAVPASTFLATRDEPDLELQLAGLLEAGTVVPFGRGQVALAPELRLSLLGRGALSHWLQGIELVQGEDISGLLREAIRIELRALTQWAATAQLPPDLVQCAAELAGVLASTTLDPSFMHAVVGLPGTARDRLARLLAVPEASCGSELELRAAVAKAVPVPVPAPPRS